MSVSSMKDINNIWHMNGRMIEQASILLTGTPKSQHMSDEINAGDKWRTNTNAGKWSHLTYLEAIVAQDDHGMSRKFQVTSSRNKSFK